MWRVINVWKNGIALTPTYNYIPNDSPDLLIFYISIKEKNYVQNNIKKGSKIVISDSMHCLTYLQFFCKILR